MHTIDVVVIVVYMAALVSVGMKAARRQNTTDRYFLAERSIPGWAIGMSLMATIITSVTFIAYPGAAYAGNWNMLVPGIMFVGVIAGIGVVVVPFFRHVVTMSVYEYFGKRFGDLIRLYSSLAFAAGHFAKMGFVFYLLALTVGSITSWNLTDVIVILGVITIFYTLIGGMEAVIWTDVLQGFVLWAGVIVSIGLLLFSHKVHAGAMLHVIAANHKTSLGSMHFDLRGPTFWTMAIYGLFFYLQKYTADQTVVQRYLAAKTDRAALRGIGMGAMLCLPVWTAFMFIGSLLWAFYRLTGEHLPATITQAGPDLSALYGDGDAGGSRWIISGGTVWRGDVDAGVGLELPCCHCGRRFLWPPFSVANRQAATAGWQDGGGGERCAGDCGCAAIGRESWVGVGALLHGDGDCGWRLGRAVSAGLSGATCGKDGGGGRRRCQSSVYGLGNADDAWRPDAESGAVELFVASGHDWCGGECAVAGGWLWHQRGSPCRCF